MYIQIKILKLVKGSNQTAGSPFALIQCESPIWRCIRTCLNQTNGARGRGVGGGHSSVWDGRLVNADPIFQFSERFAMKVPAKLLNGTEGTGPHVAPSHDTEEKGHTLGIIHSQLYHTSYQTYMKYSTRAILISH